jgi:hypothetical protein
LLKSTHDEKVVGSNLVSYKTLAENWVKATQRQERFLHLILVHFENKEKQLAKWGTPKKILLTKELHFDLKISI